MTSEPTAHTPQMPDRSQRVREVLLRFETSTDRPSVLQSLTDEQLYEIGLLLSDRELSIADAWRESNASLGLEKQIARRTFYRFADKFKKLLGQVTAGYQGMMLDAQNILEIKEEVKLLREQNASLLSDIRLVKEALCDG